MYQDNIRSDGSSSGDCRNNARHILLVDDDQGVVDVERQMLERLGFRVTSITDSLAALDVFCAHPDNFDLIITDLTMPGMGGNLLVEKIVGIRSDIPIILCTGLNDSIEDNKDLHHGIKGVLNKPVLMAQLSESINKTFGSTEDE